MRKGKVHFVSVPFSHSKDGPLRRLGYVFRLCAGCGGCEPGVVRRIALGTTLLNSITTGLSKRRRIIGTVDKLKCGFAGNEGKVLRGLVEALVHVTFGDGSFSFVLRGPSSIKVVGNFGLIPSSRVFLVGNSKMSLGRFIFSRTPNGARLGMLFPTEVLLSGKIVRFVSTTGLLRGQFVKGMGFVLTNSYSGRGLTILKRRGLESLLISSCVR